MPNSTIPARAPISPSINLIDFIEAAERLAVTFLRVDPAGEGERSMICERCLRGTLDMELLHAPTCLVGMVLAMGAVQRKQLAAKALSAAKKINADIDTCGDDLYDPGLDRHLICTLAPGHGGPHYDSIDNLHWDEPAKFTGDAAALEAELAKLTVFEVADGSAVNPLAHECAR